MIEMRLQLIVNGMNGDTENVPKRVAGELRLTFVTRKLKQLMVAKIVKENQQTLRLATNSHAPVDYEQCMYFRFKNFSNKFF